MKLRFYKNTKKIVFDINLRHRYRENVCFDYFEFKIVSHKYIVPDESRIEINLTIFGCKFMIAYRMKKRKKR